MNRDFVEMLSALVEAQAEFLIVGAHAWLRTASLGPRATWASGFVPCQRMPIAF